MGKRNDQGDEVRSVIALLNAPNDVDPSEVLLRAGRLLRSRRVHPEEKERIRELLPNLLNGLDEIETAADLIINPIFSIIEALEKGTHPDGGDRLDTILSLLLLREDLETYCEAISAALVAAMGNWTRVPNWVQEEAGDLLAELSEHH